jgi:NAD(P)-dependent dehydrogenase (short-subunit alcohol dehydrogenase family)
MNGQYLRYEKRFVRAYGSRVAVVTGAGSGIGLALAKCLARSGARVILADLQGDKVEEAAESILREGGVARAAKVDVADFRGVDDLIQRIFVENGRLDFLFNNAGIAVGGAIYHYSIEDWQAMVAVNLLGVVNGVHAAYRLMKKQGSGHIVNTASAAALGASGRSVGYTATKHAVFGLSISLRSQAAAHGVKVSVLCPAFVQTDMLVGGGKYGKELVPLTPEERKRMMDALKPVSPDAFALKALNAISLNKTIFIESPMARVMWWVYRASPLLGIQLDHLMLKCSPLARTLQ